MDKINVKINDTETIQVEVQRKNVRKVRLKVFSDCKVTISVPNSIKDEWIVDFLNSKNKWIESKVSEYGKTLGTQAIRILKSGMSIKFFNVDTIVIINKANKKDVYFEDDKIVIDTLDIEKNHIIKAQLEEYMKKELLKTLDKKLNSLFYIINKEGFDMPKVSVRKMQTMWGSCNPTKGKTTFNFYLYQSPKECIEYVVLHELLHFIHMNHSKEFYELLNVYMPDWKARKSKLDNEVVAYIS